MGAHLFFICNIQTVMMNKLLVSIICLQLFCGCLREEQPLPPHISGDINTVSITIGYPYRYQVYYDCTTNTILQSNSKYDWDIALECSPTGYHVLLNNALGMLAANLGDMPIQSIPDLSGLSWGWDNPDGNLDSTALGDWRIDHPTYLINRQYNDEGDFLGYEKLQIVELDSEHYTIKYCPKDSTRAITKNIAKNYNRNFIYFNFDNGNIQDLEPAKDKWDLLFTNHHHKFDNLTYPFVLTQVLTNKHNGITVAEDNQNRFNTISLKDTASYTFTNLWDEIGYDWKIRNSADNSFTIDPLKSYIIKANDKKFYKIRFIDFYNAVGEKGYPKFEIQSL